MTEVTKLYNKDMKTEEYKDFPSSMLKRVLDRNDNVLFGSRTIKGLVQYQYIPAEYMEEGVDLIVSTSISYDGKGLSGIDPLKEEILSFEELKGRFPNNIFA